MTDQTRRNAMALTLNRLRTNDPASAYELLPALCQTDPIRELTDLAIHLAGAMANVLEQETGSRTAAAEAIEKQIAEPDTNRSTK